MFFLNHAPIRSVWPGVRPLPFWGDCNVIARLRRRLRLFVRQEDGSATIESVLWFPVFFLVLLIAVATTQICIGQSRALRVLQDGNRAYALGRITASNGKTAADNTATWITARVAAISPKAIVTSVTSTTDGADMILSTIQMPVGDLTGIKSLSSIVGRYVIVSAQQVKEY